MMRAIPNFNKQSLCRNVSKLLCNTTTKQPRLRPLSQTVSTQLRKGTTLASSSSSSSVDFPKLSNRNSGRTFSLAQREEEYEEDHQEQQQHYHHHHQQQQHDYHHHHHKPLVATRIPEELDVSVSADGTSISLLFGTEPSTFHAQWLWTYDPQYVHTTSGQRLRSPQLFYNSRVRIIKAEILNRDDFDDETKKNQLPKPPPLGSLHPVKVYDIPKVPQYGYEHDELEIEAHRQLLCITWEQGSNKTKTVTYYDLDWLQRCRYDQEALRRRLHETIVDKHQALCARDALQTLNYHSLLISDYDDALCDLLHAVIDEGAAIVKDAPGLENNDIDENDDENATVAKVARMLGGELSHSQLYGKLFHVRSVMDANNIAYTSVHLAPHQDLSYYQSPPGLQLLHCVENSPNVIGGESTLIDAMAAAEEFRHLAPDLAEVLIHCNATFVKQRNGADMVYRCPHFRIAPSGTHVTSVHWSPPFEGPLTIPEEHVEDYFIAYSAFERMVDNSFPRLRSYSVSQDHRLLPMLPVSLEAQLCDYAHEHTWEKRLEEGEILIFNNLRMLHGRRAFTMDNNNASGRRHLIGCYTNIDDTVNKYRLLRRKRFLHNHRELPFIRNSGNGSSSTN